MTWLAQRILTELTRAPAGLPVDALAARLDRPAKNIDMACIALHRRGLLDRPEYGRYTLAPTGETLLAGGGAVRSGPAHGRRPKTTPHTLRHRVWHALGNRKKATLAELLTVACCGDERDPERNIRRYLRLLERTGYLIRLRDRQPGLSPTSPGHIKWLLLRWTGPRAPIALRDHQALHDPNLRETIAPAGSPPFQGGVAQSAGVVHSGGSIP